MADIVFPATFDALAELQYSRKLMIKSATRLTNALGAQCRRAMGWNMTLPEAERDKIAKRADKLMRRALSDGVVPDGEDEDVFDMLAPDIMAIRESIAPLVKQRAAYEKEMRKLSRGLPAWANFAEGVHGLGDLGFAVIVAECGDLANYATVSRVWKRLGLAPHDGKAYSTWRREGGLTAEDWTEAGYSPRRRAEIYACVGDPLFRQQSVVKGPYRDVYLARRERTAETHPDWTKAHSHNDALRIMTKAMLRDLWCAWNGREVKQIAA